MMGASQGETEIPLPLAEQGPEAWQSLKFPVPRDRLAGEKTVSGTFSGSPSVPHCVFQTELCNRLGGHFPEPYGLHVFMA
jgi:hypothetical protein